MNEIIQTNPLQRGSTIYVEGIPAVIKRAQVACSPVLEPDFGYTHTQGQAHYLPINAFVITGELEVSVGLGDATHLYQKIGQLVNVTIGRATAKLGLESIGVDQDRVSIRLYASVTKFTPEKDHKELPPPMISPAAI